MTEPAKIETPPVPAPQPKPQMPTVGRIVHYVLSKEDAEAVNRRRVIAGPGPKPKRGRHWAGAQSHVGNSVKAGDVVPLVVVRAWSPTCVNGQALLDGSDSLWVCSAELGEGERKWSWPPRV